MAATAVALAGRGHQISVLYFYSPGEPGSQAIIRGFDALKAQSIEIQAIDLGTVRLWESPVSSESEDGAQRRTSRAAEVGLYNMVLRLRDRLGQNRVQMLKRRLPVVRKAFPAVYYLARIVDVLRNLPNGVQLASRAIHSERAAGRSVTAGDRLNMYVTGAKVMADASDIELVYRRFAAFFAFQIETFRADALLIPEDIVGNLWPVAIRAGHNAGVPTIVLPYTLANKEEALQSLRREKYFQAKRNRITAVLYPRWRLAEQGADLVRLPSSHILSHEWLGISPPDPWMMNSGFADVIAVDSPASFAYFRAGGIPAEQMREVGSPSQDDMFRLRANRATQIAKLRTELPLSGDKPVLLLSGCPDQLSASVPFSEFSTTADVAAFVGESLQPLAEHYHLIVRPHPNYPDFGPLLERFGFRSTMLPTASLVPLADLFVAFASATIRWAIACGVPTVNYDVFHYGYGDFAAAKGVASISASGQFRDLVRSLTPGSPALAALAAQAKHDSAHWGLMDGRGIERIEQEIQRARVRRANVKEQQRHA